MADYSEEEVRAWIGEVEDGFPDRPRVADYAISKTEDYDGDPVWWIYILLADDTTAGEFVHARLRPIRWAVFDAIISRTPERFPVISFQRVSEHRDMLAGVGWE